MLQEIPIAKSSITIGRVDKNDIKIENLAVSRQHAQILQDGDRYIMEDLNSLNGTFVNGVRLIAGRMVAVANGDLRRQVEEGGGYFFERRHVRAGTAWVVRLQRSGPGPPGPPSTWLAGLWRKRFSLSGSPTGRVVEA